MPPQLLHVQVHQLSGAIPHVPHRDAGGPVGVVQAAHPVAPQHPVDRGPGPAKGRGQVVRPAFRPPTGPQDLPLGPPVQAVRQAVGAAGAVLQAGLPLLAEPLQPLVGGGPGHVHRLGSPGDRPSQLLDPLDQHPSAERGQPCPTMSHESLLSVGVATPTVKEALLVSTTFVGTTARAGRRASA